MKLRRMDNVGVMKAMLVSLRSREKRLDASWLVEVRKGPIFGRRDADVGC